MADTLPEGTDHVIPGAAQTAKSSSEPLNGDATNATTDASDTSSDPLSAKSAGDFKARASEKAAELKGQASDKAYAFAADGKARATDALDNVVRMIQDSATQIDEKLGTSYGDYARQAADGVAGFTDTLRDRDVEELIEDTRDLVRRSPAIMIGAAAAAGFVISRLIKAGSETLEAAAKTVEPKASTVQTAEPAASKPEASPVPPVA